MREINVEEIMTEIRQEIVDKGYTSDMLSFKDVNASTIAVKDFNIEELRAAIAAMEASKYVTWEQEIIDGGLKGFIKKVIRKLVGFVVAPLSGGQNIYNQHVSEALLQLLGYIEAQNKQIEEYDELVESLRKMIDKMEN